MLLGPSLSPRCPRARHQRHVGRWPAQCFPLPARAGKKPGGPGRTWPPAAALGTRGPLGGGAGWPSCRALGRDSPESSDRARAAAFPLTPCIPGPDVGTSRSGASLGLGLAGSSLCPILSKSRSGQQVNRLHALADCMLLCTGQIANLHFSCCPSPLLGEKRIIPKSLLLLPTSAALHTLP